MTERITLPGVSDDINALLGRLLKQLDEKSPRNLLRASYYDGKRAIRQVGSIIPPQYYRLGLVLGWSAKAVDVLAHRTKLEGFVWPDGDLDSLGYREVVDANYLLAEFSAAAVSSLIHGVVFAVNTVGGDGEPPALIHFKDALNATGDLNVRTRQLDNLLSVTSRDPENGNPTSLALYLDGMTIVGQRDQGRWSVDATEHGWGVPAEAMIFKPRTGRPWGSSRISRAVMSHHDQALRTLIRLEGHMDVYSFPELWMLGADEAIFKNPDGSQKAVWQVMLGRIKGIPDDDEAPESLARADVKQFPAASPQPHLDALMQQAMLFSGETGIPLDSLGVSNRANPTSAESYLAAREELIRNAKDSTDLWSPPLRRTMARALAIANGEREVPPEWKTIDTRWGSPIYLSRAAAADAGMKQLTAVPWLADTEVGLELLGLDEQQIKRALADKRRAQAASLVEKLTAAPVPAPPVDATEQALAASGGAGGF